MPIPTSTKTRLLEFHRSKKFVSLTPKQIYEIYQICHNFMQLNSSATVDEFEYYQLLELQFHLALQTNHDIELNSVLQKLNDKFDASKSDRLIFLKSFYVEATQGVELALQYLKESKKYMAIDGNPNHLVELTKRELFLTTKLDLLTNKKKPDACQKDYLRKLINFLEVHPLDTLLWVELSNKYLEVGQFSQAIFTLQEVLLIQPFAYNICCKIAELHYLKYLQLTSTSTLSKSDIEAAVELKTLAIKYYCRSLELCNNYVRAWCGLLKITSKSSSNKSLSKIQTKSELDKELKLKDAALKNLRTICEKDLSSNETLKAYIEKIIKTV